MEQKHIPTDEQIARFLDGTASEEEKEVILEYMSHSDENLDELMAIVDAVQAQRNSNQAIKQSNNRVVAWRVAASVAVVLVAGGIWFALRDRGVNLEPQAGNTVAMNTPATPPSTTEPGTTVAPEGNGTDVAPTVTTTPSNGRNNSSDLVADAGQASSGNEALSSKYNSLPVGTTNAASDVDGDIYAASSEVIGGNPTNPPVTMYDIVVEISKEWKVGTNLPIKWKCNAPKVCLCLKPRDSKECIYEKTFQFGQDSVVVGDEVREILTIEADDIQWRVKAYFSDGKITEKNGWIKSVK